MDLNRMRFPGQRWLRRRVERECAPVAGPTQLGHRFGDWIQAGTEAPPATVQAVEDHLAAYLGTAASAGRRWGFQVGLAVGAALFVAGVLFTALLRVVFG